jgi:hypothetical protein
MAARTDSAKPLEPDAEHLWLKGSGASISITRTDDERAIEILNAVRARYGRSLRPSGPAKGVPGSGGKGQAHRP